MKTTALFTPLMLTSLKPRAREYTLYDAQCDGLALRIQPSGAKSWVCWQRQNGKTRRVTLGRLENLALDTARRQHRALEAGDGAPPIPLIKSTPTFHALSQAFVTAKRGTYRPSTLKALHIYLDGQLRPAFGDIQLHQLTTPDIARWFHSYSRLRGGGANQALGHFTTIFNWGKSANLLPYELPNPAKPLRPNRRRPRGAILNAEDLDRLAQVLTHATTAQMPAAHAVRLILFTGCRSGEILRLKWSEVKGDKLHLRQTKTGPRNVQLSDPALALLKTLEENRSSPYVFPCPHDRSKPRVKIDHAWTTFKRQAKLAPTLRLHDLRHTYASHAIMSGETLFMTGKLLGHRNAKSTERYTHLDGQYLIKAANKVSLRVEELLGGSGME